MLGDDVAVVLLVLVVSRVVRVQTAESVPIRVLHFKTQVSSKFGDDGITMAVGLLYSVIFGSDFSPFIWISGVKLRSFLPTYFIMVTYMAIHFQITHDTFWHFSDPYATFVFYKITVFNTFKPCTK